MTTPQKRDQRRPLELLGLCALIAAVVGLVVLAATREPRLALLWGGVAFIVVIVVVAMLVLTTNPEAGRRRDDEGPHGH